MFTPVEHTPVTWEPVELTASDEVVLFVTYSHDDHVTERIRYYLQCLKDIGLKVILIRNLKNFSNIPADKVQFVDGNVLRANEGYDFGAWAHVLKLYPGLWNTKLLILVNDSVFGPSDSKKLTYVLERIRTSEADYIGLTESFEISHHIQSYFVALKVIGKSVHIFQEFWNKVDNCLDKSAVKCNYEVTALDFFSSRGIKSEILFPIDRWGHSGDSGIGRFITKIKKPITPEKKKSTPLKAIERYVKNRILPPRPLSAIVVPFPCAVGNACFNLSTSIAVIIHIYYVDVVKEMITFIGNIPYSIKLYITTDTVDKSRQIKEAIAKKHPYEIRLSPNKGRDIAPKWITFSDAYKKHDYFLHLHTKKTLYNEVFGGNWRAHLLNTLVGSEEIVRSNLEILAREDVGIVYPRHISALSLSDRWKHNFTNAAAFLDALGITIKRDKYFDFPAGSMYWGKSKAILPILDLNLSWDDFPEELGQKNGTLAHAIERSILFVAEKQGFHGQDVICQDFTLPGYKFVRIKNSDSLDKAIELSRQIIAKMKSGQLKAI